MKSTFGGNYEIDPTLFVGQVIFSLAFLATTVVPRPVHATPKTMTNGEYPETEGACCTDVEYASKSSDGHGAEGAMFVTSPNPDAPTMVHIEMYVDQITEVDDSANSYKMQ